MYLIKCRSTTSAWLSAHAPNYRQTDLHHTLVVGILCPKLEHNCTLLFLANQSTNIDHYGPDIWPWYLTLTSKQGKWQQTVMLNPIFISWPLTYNPNLSKVKVDLHTKYQDLRSNSSSRRAQTSTQTNGRYQVYYLPASLSYAVDKYTCGWRTFSEHIL